VTLKVADRERALSVASPDRESSLSRWERLSGSLTRRTPPRLKWTVRSAQVRPGVVRRTRTAPARAERTRRYRPRAMVGVASTSIATGGRAPRRST